MKKKPALPPGVRERDGRFTFRYSVEVVVNGKRTRKQKETESFPSAKEAYSAGILIEANKLQGRLIDEKTITLGSWCDRWLKEYTIEREPRPTTLKNRRIALIALKKYIGEHTRMKDITSYDYQQFLNNLKLEKKRKGTIKEYHTGARMLFVDATRKKIIASNPALEAAIPVFKITLAEIESGSLELPLFLEKKQLKHLLQTIRFRGLAQDYNIFHILAYTGLRIGELLAMKTTDFDEGSRTLSVTKTLTVVDGIPNYILGPPKNKPSIRKISIGKETIKIIQSQLAWRDKQIADGESIHDSDFIFWNHEIPGYPGCSGYVRRRFAILLNQANIPSTLTPHSLRHTHVSLLAEAGEDLTVIQERLGHKNDDVTRRIYLHVTETQRKLTPDRFEKLMES